VSGECLLDLTIDSKINPVLLSSFVGALSLFGKDSIGKIEEIKIRGLDLDIIIITRHNLVLVALINSLFMRDYLKIIAEKALGMFHVLYKKEIENFLISGKFDSFKKILNVQIDEYLEEIAKESPDFGFLKESMKESNNNSN